MPNYASKSLCPRAGFVSRQYRKVGLLPQALRISSSRFGKSIPLKLHTRRASDGGIETVKAIIEGTTYDIHWKLTTAVTLLQVGAVAQHVRERFLTSKECRSVHRS